MISKKFFNNSFSKIAIALVLVLAVVGSLWFASPTPVKAVEATLPNLPTKMYSGSVYSFYAQVDINTNEAIPINSLRLDISGPTPIWATFYPIGTGNLIINGSSQFVSVTCEVSPYFGYSYLYGTGYGYQPPNYGIFSHWWGYGWGYGYGYSAGLPAQAKYLVTINTAGMSLGSYEAQLSVNTGPGEKKFLSPTYSFTLSTTPAGGAGGAPPAPPEPGVTDVSGDVDPTGMFTADTTAQSVDGNVTITIETGTTGLTAEGTPLQEISIQPTEEPPPAPEGATVIDEAGTFVSTVEDITFIGIPYEFGPPGAIFSEPIAITLNLPAELPAGIDPSNLRIGWWDPAAGSWVILETTFDPVTNTLIAKTDHFSTFAIIAVPAPPPAPAAFAVSALTVSPIDVNIGETVTISVLVTNTGELTGSYEVTLKVNEVVVAAKEVTVAGGSSQKVTFTTTKDVAGTYTVDVNGISGTFMVKAPPVVPPAPAAFEVSQLSSSPAEVQVGEEVIVSATVANTGEVQGSYTVTLKVNGATEATRKVTIAGGQTTKVTFSVVKDAAASYQVDIDGQTGSFTVTKAPLAWWIWLIVGLAVVAVIVVLVVILRRRAY